MKPSKKNVLPLGKIKAAMSVLMRYAASAKQMQLLFGTALAISLVCGFQNNERRIIHDLQNAIHSDSVASPKNTFKKEVKLGSHEFVIVVK